MIKLLNNAIIVSADYLINTGLLEGTHGMPAHTACIPVNAGVPACTCPPACPPDARMQVVIAPAEVTDIPRMAPQALIPIDLCSPPHLP